ncbi:MAG: InlB B-repeat-containing protein [Oscillospiraceae bacterium]
MPNDYKWYKYTDTFKVTVNADYTLTYDANAGVDTVTGMPSPNPDKKTVASATCNFTVSNATPIREGYTFLGWAETSNATEAKYQENATVTLNWAGGTTATNKTLYAVWKKAAPNKPTDEELTNQTNGILKGDIVTVNCTNEDVEHDPETYGLIADSYTIGAVAGDPTDGYTCTITISADKYVEEYNGEIGVEHSLDENENESKTITLTWDATNKAWTAPTSGVPVTFNVKCVSYTLTYDANGGKIGGETSVKTSGLTAQKDYALNKAIVPTYTVAEGETAIVFIGWTAAQDDTIYAVGDTAPKTIEKVDIDKDVTVYAAWGYDTNGDGKADVNQTPVYVYAKFENSAGQKIEALPLNASSSLKLNEHGWLTLGYVLVDGTVTKDAAVAELSKTNGFIRYDGNAAFDLSLISSSSWSLNQYDGADNYVKSGTACYHLDGVIPVYQVTYDANGGANAPAAEQYLLPDTEHPLNSTTKPTHEKVNNVDVVFIGWTAEKDEYIYAAGDTAPVTISQVTVPAKDAAGNETDVTVYAVYGLDTDGNGIADVTEVFYKVTFDADGGSAVADQWVKENHTATKPADPTKDGYVFDKWLLNGAAYDFSTPVTGDITLVAAWKVDRNRNGIPDEEEYVTVTYTDGVKNEVVFADQAYNNLLVGDDTPAFVGTPTRAGYTFVGWTPKWSATVTGSVTYTAQWRYNYPYNPGTPSVTPDPTVKVKGLNTVDHVAYIIGVGNDEVNPLGTITRAEIANIYFRLMTDEFRNANWSTDNRFKDVPDNAWYTMAVLTLDKAGIITDSDNGNFRPNDPITRAELAAMAAQFCTITGKIPATSFKDVPSNHWAAEEIALVEYAGWIEGYEGYFRPDDNLTRAEAMTIVNRMLQRGVEEENMLAGMTTWSDNLPGSWYYEAVQEATNSHDYTRTTKLLTGEDFRGEKWTALLEATDWAALEKAWIEANSK